MPIMSRESWIGDDIRKKRGCWEIRYKFDSKYGNVFGRKGNLIFILTR